MDARATTPGRSCSSGPRVGSAVTGSDRIRVDGLLARAVRR